MGWQSHPYSPYGEDQDQEHKTCFFAHEKGTQKSPQRSQALQSPVFFLSEKIQSS